MVRSIQDGRDAGYNDYKPDNPPIYQWQKESQARDRLVLVGSVEQCESGCLARIVDAAGEIFKFRGESWQRRWLVSSDGSSTAIYRLLDTPCKYFVND